MIKIIESIPRKLSGLTSLKVQFPYKDVYVNLIKTFEPAIWNKTDSTWEVGLNHLPALLDAFTPFDDIELTLYSDNPTIEIPAELTTEEITDFKVEPFKHQIEAINFGLKKHKWLLTHGMGCGKTISAILLAETLHKRGLVDHCFIICAVASLKQQWKAEIQKYSNESCLVLGEKISKKGRISYKTLPERAEQLKNEISEFFIITNIESLRSEQVLNAFIKSKNKIQMIVVDEIHRTNNKSSLQGNNLLKLKAEYKLGMSGTLLVNNPINLYLPLVWTENDKSTLTNFKNQYCEFTTSTFTKYQIAGYKNLDLLKEELDSCSHRRTLNDVVDMPMKTVSTELLELPDDHMKFYDAIKNGVKEEADKIELNTNNLLALTTRLRQAVVDPSILSSQEIISGKIERCEEILEDLISQNEKVVVFSNFKAPLEQLAAKFKQFHPLVNTGDYSDDFVNKNVAQFMTDPTSLICLCTHSRMGTGFNLNAATYCVMLDIPFTWSALDQSICRVYRLNNKRPCYVKILLAKDTIDEHIWEIVNTKKDLGDYIMDNTGKLSESMRSDLLNIIKSL